MTQLIGAICENGKMVITVSDRMVSTGDMTLTYEQPVKKVTYLSEKIIVLTAGTVHEPDLIRQAKAQTQDKDNILQVAEILKKHFQNIRERHIVDEILRPNAGIQSFDQWRKEQKGLHDSIVIDLYNDITRYKLGLTLMLAGVDTEGHLILLGDPGTYRSSDYLSFCCVGMGDRHAQNVFAWYRYSREFTLNEALYITFEAKKKAEMAGGVGQSTDIIIIDKKEIKEISSETIKILEGIYENRETKSERGGFDKHITELKIQTNSMGNETDPVKNAKRKNENRRNKR